MNVNLLRRVNWLWKHRHKHDDDNFQEQLTVLKTTVEDQADDVAASGSGAHIHLERAASQSMGTSAEAIEWDRLNAAHTPFEFSVSPPVTEVETLKAGYYDIEVAFALDADYDDGGSVTVLRNNLAVWPPSVDSDIWTTDNGRRFAGVAKGIELEPGDTIEIQVGHNAVTAVDLEWAQLSVELVDRSLSLTDWQLVFDVDNYGVTHDGSNWWTTDDTDNINPALFKRSADGTVLNSYAGYDAPSAGDTRNRSLVYADGFLWGVGNEEAVHKVDPSTGSQVSEFATQGNSDGDAADTRRGIGYNDTNLFVTEAFTHNRIEEYNLSGTHQGNHSFPAGHSLVDLTWNGSEWWATTTTQTIIRMNAAFSVTLSIQGPTDTNQGCHWRDGFLYVMTPSGLYRRAV